MHQQEEKPDIQTLHDILKVDKLLETQAEPLPIEHYIERITEYLEEEEDAFFIGDLGDILQKDYLWRTSLPKVEPFYAVKSNDRLPVIKILADIGLSFDCASKIEIQKVLDLGVDPSKIVFANACKQKSFIQYAAVNSVDLMTFDNIDELVKIQSVFHKARLLLRIHPATNNIDLNNLGRKFGCRVDQAEHLLKTAHNLKLNVVGVSFHVGSPCMDKEAYRCAIAHAYDVFNCGLKMGFEMHIIDIGGGFPGHTTSTKCFKEIAENINKTLDTYFAGKEVKFIAEPGRFYVESAFTVAANIIGKAAVVNDIQNRAHRTFKYYLNDGMYGSFDCVRWKDSSLIPMLLKDNKETEEYDSSIWGPTCDGLDCIIANCKLQELNQGDWIYFRDMGAYSFSVASNFNGMPHPKPFYVFNGQLWKY